MNEAEKTLLIDEICEIISNNISTMVKPNEKHGFGTTHQVVGFHDAAYSIVTRLEEKKII